MSCLGFPTGTAASHPERPAGGALRHSERPAFNGSPISDFERIIDLAARQARPQLTVDIYIYIYISQTLHGTAIYAAPLTPKTTPTDRHIWHTWSVWAFFRGSFLGWLCVVPVFSSKPTTRGVFQVLRSAAEESRRRRRWNRPIAVVRFQSVFESDMSLRRAE